MYRLYTDWARLNDKFTATKHYYCDIFNTRFNISFFKPKKDQCNQCEIYKNTADPDAKSKLEGKYQAHLTNSEKAQDLKTQAAKAAKKDKGQNTSVFCYDFQKVLCTPKAEASSLYYKRKLSVSNFTIYDIGTHEAYCYVWDENDAKKGLNEVASCVLDFIKKK